MYVRRHGNVGVNVLYLLSCVSMVKPSEFVGAPQHFKTAILYCGCINSHHHTQHLLWLKTAYFVPVSEILVPFPAAANARLYTGNQRGRKKKCIMDMMDTLVLSV